MNNRTTINIITVPLLRKTHRGKKAGTCAKKTIMDMIRKKNINVGYWNCRSAKQRGAKLKRII
jgi:hypothetical protein